MSDILDAFKDTQGEESVKTDGRKLRIGIIGCGGIAKRHAEAYLHMPDAEIVAGCDLIPGKAAEFMRSFGLEGAKTHYRDHIEMLSDESLELDAVSFDYKNKAQGTDKRGFIAEDVAKVLPGLVTPETENAPASLDYVGMIPYLQDIIKKQEKRIEALEGKINKIGG